MSPEVDRILTPALTRERGFLARTLRLSPASLPDWLKTRRADGTLSIDSLGVGDSQVRIDSARLLWDGAVVRLVRVKARADQVSFGGEVALDLTGPSPHYRIEGKLTDVAYNGGKLDFDGSLDLDGAGVQLLASARV